MKNKKLVVIGGGAAGFFAAINAKLRYPELEVLILEKQNKVLQKVKVSGGGRCNIMHDALSVEHLLLHYPRGKNFLKKVFYQFGTKETKEWFENAGLHLKTETDGRMFPQANSSQAVIDLFFHFIHELNIAIAYNHAVQKVEKNNDIFIITCINETIMADYLLISSGGFHHELAYQFIGDLGHTIKKPIPSLFTFNIEGVEEFKKLQGVSVPKVQVKIPECKASETGPVLITHWGLSGPVVLRLSAWFAEKLFEKNYHTPVVINWICKNEESIRQDWNKIRNEMAGQSIIKNPFELPKRLWLFLLWQANINENEFWNSLKSKEQNKLIQLLCHFTLNMKGKTTFKEEFVSCGGVSLNEVQPQTMQSRICSNLFFAGEVLDIDGITGGFNFQAAWSTAWIASKLGMH